MPLLGIYFNMVSNPEAVDFILFTFCLPTVYDIILTRIL